MEDQGIDGKIILEWIIGKEGGKVGRCGLVMSGLGEGLWHATVNMVMKIWAP
jgi:hypothetical protein